MRRPVHAVLFGQRQIGSEALDTVHHLGAQRRWRAHQEDEEQVDEENAATATRTGSWWVASRSIHMEISISAMVETATKPIKASARMVMILLNSERPRRRLRPNPEGEGAEEDRKEGGNKNQRVTSSCRSPKMKRQNDHGNREPMPNAV